MQHLLLVKGIPCRIGTVEQMCAFKRTYLPTDDNVKVTPVYEVKRIITLWYYTENDAYGNSLFIFRENAKLFAGGKMVFELPMHQPQGELL